MTEHSLPVGGAITTLRLDAGRKLQIALGSIWLLDGALQLQPFMFGRSFVTQIIAPNEVAQPGVVAAPIRLMAHVIEPRVALFNLLAVTIQLLIGIGLIYRPTVKAALLASFGWALSVWWFGEGLGGLLTGNASPLTGAPGAALLYVFAGLIAWPRAASSASAEPAAPARCSGSDLPRCGYCPPIAQTPPCTTQSRTRHRAHAGSRVFKRPPPRPRPDTDSRSRSSRRAYRPPSACRRCPVAGQSLPWRCR
jgi:hypothetical protein